MAGNVFGLCVRCLCALACVSESNDAKPVLPAVGNVEHKCSIRERKKNLIKTEGKAKKYV